MKSHRLLLGLVLCWLRAGGPSRPFDCLRGRPASVGRLRDGSINWKGSPSRVQSRDCRHGGRSALLPAGLALVLGERASLVDAAHPKSRAQDSGDEHRGTAPGLVPNHRGPKAPGGIAVFTPAHRIAEANAAGTSRWEISPRRAASLWAPGHGSRPFESCAGRAGRGQH
jgi:hypothetical protein